MLCGLLADKNKNTSDYSTGVSVCRRVLHSSHDMIPRRVL